MKLIAVILLATTAMYAQEFGIQGNLSVSGLILNSTIDSLQAENQGLNARIDSLEANSSDVKTKLYDVLLPTYTSFHSLVDITGEVSDWYLVQVVAFSFDLVGNFRIEEYGAGETVVYPPGYYYGDSPSQQVYSDAVLEFRYYNGGSEPLNESVTIMVTTPISN